MTARPDHPEPVRPPAAVRGMAVMLGGSLALAAASLASFAGGARALRERRLPGRAAGAGVIATAVYAVKVRPWMLRWGATQAESDGGLPTRAVTIGASPEEVWPWLAQIGQDRGGFYSYEWLENLAGCRMRNASRIHPEWQQRAPGEKVLLHPAFGLEVARFEPGRALVLEGWGAFLLEPVDAQHTRLVARGQAPAGPLAAVYGLLLELPHFVMERKMLLGIKERAERTGTRSGRAVPWRRRTPSPARS